MTWLHKNMWLLAFAFAIFVYLVDYDLFHEIFFYFFSFCWLSRDDLLKDGYSLCAAHLYEDSVCLTSLFPCVDKFTSMPLWGHSSLSLKLYWAIQGSFKPVSFGANRLTISKVVALPFSSVWATHDYMRERSLCFLRFVCWWNKRCKCRKKISVA